MFVGWGLGFMGNPLSSGCTWQSTCFLFPNPCLSGPSLSPCCPGDKSLGREPHQLPLQWSDIAYGYLPTYPLLSPSRFMGTHGGGASLRLYNQAQ